MAFIVVKSLFDELDPVNFCFSFANNNIYEKRVPHVKNPDDLSFHPLWCVSKFIAEQLQ